MTKPETEKVMEHTTCFQSHVCELRLERRPRHEKHAAHTAKRMRMHIPSIPRPRAAIAYRSGGASGFAIGRWSGRRLSAFFIDEMLILHRGQLVHVRPPRLSSETSARCVGCA